ncbi:aminoglycoside phosphotransferase family protein [Streptomyces sp. M54]|uniref:aminoglycoside phosphotransferase family protein n=1 Tax=Streptomyces sp. M54 TaxID=2759525 RepID=UPI001A8D3F43|nr:aminoglycoside phosphotransferase family protein [Streptomyces sp. M54]QSS91317.1 aminoglycoside phosphotransferase family protein [Streptomyces sp. M54]
MIIEPSLVRGLIAAQFPHWSDLPVEAAGTGGTANAIYRLGADMSVRLPRTEGSAADVATEQRWLPKLAPRLPFPVPTPLAQGAASEGFPRPWSVHTWLDGVNPAPGDATASSDLFAADLAEFVLALRRIDPQDAPPAYRAEPLASRDEATRTALASVGGVVDVEAATTEWKEALAAPPHTGRPVWVHGDLQPGNVLVDDGRLTAVIDFGCTGLADPAVDLIAAWYLLAPDARDTFRTALAPDDATWARGRGWALSIALLELAHYRETDPRMARIAAHVIEELLHSR